MKKILIAIFALVFIDSCVVFDVIRMMKIVNRTCDTILVGKAYCNNIDSTKFFIQHSGFILYTDSMKMKEDLWFDNSNLIYPDSFGTTGANYLIKEKTGYFFIIKLDIAKTHTWEEICKNHLYDTLVATCEMLNESNQIEYHGN